MGKYTKISKEIIALVGGKDNILKSYHCMTRLRFNLYDEKLVNIEEIKKIPEVVGARFQGGQFQIIIGNKVSDVYKDVATELGIISKNGNSNVDFSTNKILKDNKKFTFGAIVDFISSLFTPIIGAISAAGILLGIFTLFNSVGVISDKTTEWTVIQIIGNSAMNVLPILIAITAAQKLNTSVPLAVVIAGALISPQMLGLGGIDINFLGIPLKAISYTGAVFPPIFIVFSLKYMKIGLEKIIPEAIKFILVPTVIVLVLIPVTLLALGPAGFYVGTGFAYIFENAFAWQPWIGGMLIGALWPILVTFGMHYPLFPGILESVGPNGNGDYIMIASIIANCAVAGTALGLFIILRNKNNKQVLGTAAVSGICGVTEPTIYGGLLKYKSTFVTTIITGAIFGGVATSLGIKGHAFVPPGFLTLPTFWDHSNISGSIGLMITTVCAYFFATGTVLLFGINENPDKYKATYEGIKWYQIKNRFIISRKNRKLEKQIWIKYKNEIKKSLKIDSPVSGKIFRNENGFEISTNNNKIYSPVNGIIKSIDQNNFKIEIENTNQLISLNILLDSTLLNYKIKNGDLIQKGQAIIDIDIKNFKVQKLKKYKVAVIIESETSEVIELIIFDEIRKNKHVLGIKEK